MYTKTRTTTVTSKLTGRSEVKKKIEILHTYINELFTKAKPTTYLMWKSITLAYLLDILEIATMVVP